MDRSATNIPSAYGIANIALNDAMILPYNAKPGRMEFPEATGGGGGGGLSADAQAILNAHNGYRAKHCVANLTWSTQLAGGAQDWANACPSNSKGGFAHSNSGGAYGENLAWGTSMSGPGSVDMWYSEIGNYNFNAPSWNNSVGHFTQVVWRNSAQVGCAVASCSGQDFWVCRYSPPGNWNVDVPGELANNVPPPCK